MKKREFRSSVCAMLLGDGFISERDGQFGLAHSPKQLDYLLWKVELINTIFREKNLPRRFHLRKVVYNVKGKKYAGYQANLYWKDYLRRLYKKAYNGKFKNHEYLLSQINSDLHLAIWFMDDGTETRRTSKRKDGTVYTCNPYFRLCTYSTFTDGGHIYIVDWFRRKYEVSPRIVNTKKGKYLVFNTEDSRLLFKRMEKYFKDLESMRYKFRLAFERYYTERPSAS